MKKLLNKIKKCLHLWSDEDMVDFALYFWKNGEGATATRDGVIRHFTNFKKA